MEIDFTDVTDSDLLDIAGNLSGAYDGLRIYAGGALAELADSVKKAWDIVRPEVERRDLGHYLGL